MVKIESGGGKSRRETEWRERLARFAARAVQVKQFCQWESVSAASFYRWRKLLDHDGTADAGRFIDVGALAPTQTAQTPPGMPGRMDAAELEVRLDLGHGLTLYIVRR